MTTIKIFLYSKEDGSLIKEFQLSEMFEARQEYENLVRQGKNPGYLESVFFPTSDPKSEMIWDKNILNFRFKTAEERVAAGTLVLKPHQKIVNNVVIDKSFYELYTEGQIFHTPDTIIYKVTESGRILRKTLVELLETGYDKKLIFEGLVAAVNKVLDVKRADLDKKFPRAEIDFFTTKATVASQWLAYTPEEKADIIKDPNRRGAFNLLFEEFWVSLTEAQKNDFGFLLGKLNDLCVVITENNKKYSEALALIVDERKKLATTWRGRENELTKQDILDIYSKYNIDGEQTYLFETAYAIPPDLNKIDPRRNE